MAQIIDGSWISSQLTGRRGEKADLARSLGVRPDIVSKIISGERSVQPEELPKLLAFFKMKLVPEGSVDDARNEIMTYVEKLNGEGLALLQQQLAVLANTPSLSKKS